MKIVGQKIIQNGSVLLMEILIAIALITACATVIAQYCWKIHSVQHDVKQRIDMLNNAQNIMDALLSNNQEIPSIGSNQEGAEIASIPIPLPRIYSDIPEVIALTKGSMLAKVTAQWRDGAGKTRSITLHCGKMAT